MITPDVAGGLLRSPPNSEAGVPDDAALTDEAAFSVTFGRMANILLTSDVYCKLPLLEVAELLQPPILLGQCAVFHEPIGELPTASAFAVWAFVSPEVDDRLTTIASGPLRLSPEDWSSGDIPWLIECHGEPSAVDALLQYLIDGPLANPETRGRILSTDGACQIVKLAELAPIKTPE
ncbi:MAG: toxin-activating lysine-acyltransferase [Hyphomicrobium sp.]